MGGISQQVGTDHHALGPFVQMQYCRFIEQVHVLLGDAQGVADGALLGQQQAGDTELRELPHLRQTQAEGRTAAGAGRQLEQAHHGISGNQPVGRFQLTGVQAGLPQQLCRIEPEFTGDSRVVGQYPGTHHGHIQSSRMRSAQKSVRRVSLREMVNHWRDLRNHGWAGVYRL